MGSERRGDYQGPPWGQMVNKGGLVLILGFVTLAYCPPAGSSVVLEMPFLGGSRAHISYITVTNYISLVIVDTYFFPSANLYAQASGNF